MHMCNDVLLPVLLLIISSLESSVKFNYLVKRTLKNAHKRNETERKQEFLGPFHAHFKFTLLPSRL